MEDAARPWTAFYGPHVRTEIETASHRTLPDLIGGVAETYPLGARLHLRPAQRHERHAQLRAGR
jgi:hypothetical protein